MRKSIIKGTIGGLIFVVALIVFSLLMNKGNTDMTTDMAEATFPVASILYEEEKINIMHGYLGNRELNYIRDNITPLTDQREVTFDINKYGNVVSQLSFEVRSIDAERLVEKTVIEEFEDQDDHLRATIQLKDLIEENVEYHLEIIVNCQDGKEIRYHTRVILAKDYFAKEKIDFAKNFHEKSFDKVLATELTTYMESNAQGDNTTYSKVDIHSSFSQITWGDLEIVQEGDEKIEIQELDKQIANIKINYYVSAKIYGEKKYFRVSEYYRMRYGTQRIYLLDFSRKMNQVFQYDASAFSSNRLMLGITNPNIEYKESSDGNIFSFVLENKLYAYNLTENRMSRLFGYYEDPLEDERNVLDDHGVKIIKVDETGNISFLVYGYVNRGEQEGKIGIQVFQFNSGTNSIEEKVFLPYQKSFELLKSDVENLAYVNNSNEFFIILDESLYCINLEQMSVKKEATHLVMGSYKVSKSNRMICWQEDNSLYHSKKLILMNLNTHAKNEIAVGEQESLMPLGFMNEDFIYGIAKEYDIVNDKTGKIIFPMHTVRIQSEEGTVLDEYKKPDIYITQASIVDNQISLSRVQKEVETNEFVSTTDDQILSNSSKEEAENSIEIAATKEYEKLVQIVLKKEIKEKSIQYLTPKQVMYEGEREYVLEEEGILQERYYTYAKDGLVGIYTNPSLAIQDAFEQSGVVVNDRGSYIWTKGLMNTKNQIMKIKERSVTTEKNSLAVCLDAMLENEGVLKNSEYLLSQGKSVQEILGENLEGTYVLDLTGCSLEEVLYYVDLDIPVLAMLDRGHSVLIIGFNEKNTVIMDPQTGVIYKKGMQDSIEWFERYKNQFITYAKVN